MDPPHSHRLDNVNGRLLKQDNRSRYLHLHHISSQHSTPTQIYLGALGRKKNGLLL